MINNLMNAEVFEFIIWVICALLQSYLKIDQEGRTWMVILVKDCVTIWTATLIPLFLCFPGSGEMVYAIEFLENTGNMTWGPNTKVHFDIHPHTSFLHHPDICCPEILWSLILAGVCNQSSESSRVKVLCLLAGLIKSSYSSALNGWKFCIRKQSCSKDYGITEK